MRFLESAVTSDNLIGQRKDDRVGRLRHPDDQKCGTKLFPNSSKVSDEVDAHACQEIR